MERSLDHFQVELPANHLGIISKCDHLVYRVARTSSRKTDCLSNTPKYGTTSNEVTYDRLDNVSICRHRRNSRPQYHKHIVVIGGIQDHNTTNHKFPPPGAHPFQLLKFQDAHLFILVRCRKLFAAAKEVQQTMDDKYISTSTVPHFLRSNRVAPL